MNKKKKCFTTEQSTETLLLLFFVALRSSPHPGRAINRYALYQLIDLLLCRNPESNLLHSNILLKDS